MAAFDKTTFTDHGDIRVLHVPTELEVYTAPSLRQASVDAVNDGRYNLLIDLSQTTFVDTTGFGVLLGVRKRVQKYGGTLRLAGPISDGVARALRISGLVKVFEIVDTVEMAIDANEEA